MFQYPSIKFMCKNFLQKICDCSYLWGQDGFIVSQSVTFGEEE